MNAVNVISWEVNANELVHKFDSDELRLGSQLIVYPSQLAFFVKGGKILDEFQSGTYTISSDNIPLLGKIINIPFNGETPFKAEVWFVNQISILNNKWGTSSFLQIKDPIYGIIVPIKAYGRYGFHINNPRLFLERFVGNMRTFSTETVVDYFKGVLLSKLTRIIYEALSESNQSVITISSRVESLSTYAQTALAENFAEYGILLETFDIIAITVKEDDPSFIRLKAAIDLKARINVIGREDYKMTRTFDVLEEAAGNQSGLAGAAMGLGTGFGLAKTAATLASSVINLDGGEVPPIPTVPAKSYYLAINGQQNGPFNKDVIDRMYTERLIDDDTLIWTKGMSQWCKLSDCSDFAHLQSNCPPPIPTV